MNESTKNKAYWGEIERKATSGRGIDIGCGGDPVSSSCRCFDVADGDANQITKYVNEQFDFVYSSHCLEHMHDPRKAILEWWQLVRPSGYLFVTVPDEDLYEQGVFPSRFNSDHKATFTLAKASSWSPVSHNVLELAQSLPGASVVSLCLQDRGYDRRLASSGPAKGGFLARALAWLYGRIAHFYGEGGSVAFRRLLTLYYPIDQTSPPFNAQAQIQLIVQKTG